MAEGTTTRERLDALWNAARSLARASGARPTGSRLPRPSSPVLDALRRAGTRHVYGDTADTHELAGLALSPEGIIPDELDGNTANQPLVRRVVDEYAEAEVLRGWDESLRSAAAYGPQGTGRGARAELLPWLYGLVCARIGNEFARSFGAGHRWDGSVQIHMALTRDPRAAVRIGELIADAVPGVLVKVPFAPDAPATLLVARELQKRGIAVNLTSTFSARQVAVAALLADTARTNVFLGRIDQGLQGNRLGAHVVLQAQRVLTQLRERDGVRTELIAASLREWETFLHLAGCDAFTAPCEVIHQFLLQATPDEVRDQRSLEPKGAPAPSEIAQKVGPERIERLHRVEDEFLEFLRAFRASADWPRLDVEDGDALRARFEQAGFGDFFHDPSDGERKELERSKLPLLDGALIGRIALDTHYTLAANADFAKHQAAIDDVLQKAVERPAALPGGRPESRPEARPDVRPEARSGNAGGAG